MFGKGVLGYYVRVALQDTTQNLFLSLIDELPKMDNKKQTEGITYTYLALNVHNVQQQQSAVVDNL